MIEKERGRKLYNGQNFGFVEEKLLPPMAKFAEIRYLRAIRDGMISTMPFTVSAPINGTLGTASWRCGALQIVNFIVMLIIFYPFAKAYDKQMLEKEQVGEEF